MRKIIDIGPAYLLLILAGCGAGVIQEHDPGVKLDTRQYQDLPVPEGFTLVERDTWSYLSQSVRVAQYHYYSGAEAPKAFAFMTTKVQELGWTVTEGPPLLGWQSASFRRERDRLLAKMRQLRDERVEMWVLVNLDAENPKEPG